MGLHDDSVNPQMDAYRNGTAKALTGCIGVYGTDWTDPDTTDLDRFTDHELCQMHLDAGRRALTHFTNVERLIMHMARMDPDDPEYARIEQTMRISHETGIEAHELVLHIASVLRTRRANADA